MIKVNANILALFALLFWSMQLQAKILLFLFPFSTKSFPRLLVKINISFCIDNPCVFFLFSFNKLQKIYCICAAFSDKHLFFFKAEFVARSVKHTRLTRGVMVHARSFEVNPR